MSIKVKLASRPMDDCHFWLHHKIDPKKTLLAISMHKTQNKICD